jgi:hypothetical protein
MTFNLPAQALDHELVLAFFWKFSVFEAALKRAGFLRTGRNNAAEPDWNRFAREIEGRFAEASVTGLAEAKEELRRISPRRQVVRDGKLGWEPVEQKSESDDAFTIRLMRTARNNLFHGGKYPDGPINEIARNRKILRAALTILDACYKVHAGVRQCVDQAA